jgi:hypothetical protein
MRQSAMLRNGSRDHLFSMATRWSNGRRRADDQGLAKDRFILDSGAVHRADRALSASSGLPISSVVIIPRCPAQTCAASVDVHSRRDAGVVLGAIAFQMMSRLRR